MRIVFTSLLLFAIYICRGQQPAPDSIIITGNCWGKSNVDTVKVDLQKGLTGKLVCLSASPKNEHKIKEPETQAKCYLVLPEVNQQPMLLIDGARKRPDTLSALNPNDIRSFTVLKPGQGKFLFGQSGVNGVVLVNMKRYPKRHFYIYDGHEDVVGATLTFVSLVNNEVVSFIADEYGRVDTDKLTVGEKHRLEVSSAGYQTRCIDYSCRDTDSEEYLFISMTKDIKQCSPVVLSGTVCYKRISCGAIAWHNRTNTSSGKITSSPELTRFYPNPVQKGGTFTFEWQRLSAIPAECRLYSLNGSLIRRQPLSNTAEAGMMQLQTDSRWAAGVYFLQLVCENGRVLASGKIIIQ